MLMGTGSSVGKSLLVAGLARACLRRGLRVRPFKPQNMSNNAGIAEDGREIGRAQVLQAQAAGVAPSVDMNPILLKPQSELGSQVIVHGRIHATARARDYQAMKPALMGCVLESFARLRDAADIVLVEGAGSASEINLRQGDLANFGFARATDTPVVLVGDIDRGGVIASLVGTKAVIDPADAALLRGFIVNRMRGDAGLFAAGMAAIASATGWPALGLVPFFAEARLLPAEDSADLPIARPGGRLRIVVLAYPRMANFDEFDALAAEPQVALRFLPIGTPVPEGCDLLVLPGSKATIADLRALRETGWDIDIAAYRRRGGRLLGICGGYQMLGRSIADPQGIEGAAETVPGLGLLAVDTVLTGDKRLARMRGHSLADGLDFAGYAMHVGRSDGPDAAAPLLRLADGRPDGAQSTDRLVAGTYLHGLLADDGQRSAWLRRLGGAGSIRRHAEDVERVLDALAAHLEAHVDIDRLLGLAR